MKSIGMYMSADIPISADEYGALLAYAKDEREIRIYFARKEPYYQVAYIAVLLGRTTTYERYEVFEYDYFNPSGDDVKSFIKEIVEKSIEHGS